MRHFICILGLTLTAGAAWSEELTISIDGISVQSRKPNGKHWDALRGKPDIVATFEFGRLSGSRCVAQRGTEVTLSKQKNTLRVQRVGKTVLMVPVDELCYTAYVYDKDVRVNDLIGRGTGGLTVGRNHLRFGSLQAGVTVTDRTVVSRAPVVDLGPAPARRAQPVLLTFSNADIAPTRADGTPWDEPQGHARDDWGDLEMLAKITSGFVRGGPVGGAAAVLGEVVRSDRSPKMTHSGRTVSQPDPAITVTIGGRQFHARRMRNTLNPAWSATLVIDAAKEADSLAKIQVSDADGSESEMIGTEPVLLSKIIAAKILKLKFGQVRSLTITAEPVTEAVPFKKEVSLPAGRRWVKTGIKVHAGQQIRIQGSGRHCKHQVCLGPEGNTNKRLGRTVGGSDIHHGQLAARIGDRMIGVGAGAKFTAWSSGELFVGTASPGATDSSQLVARIEVYYPISY